MGITRISTIASFNQALFNIRGRQVSLNDLSEQISSGKKLHNPSDDPIGVTQLLNIQLDTTQNDQYAKNIDEGLSEMDTVNTSIDGVIEIVQRARELAVQGANATAGPQQMDAMVQEVDGLINHLTQLGNTKFADRYLFAGFLTDSSAFTYNAGDVTYNGTPTTDPWQRQVQIGKNTFATINLNGDELFGNVTVTGPQTTTGSGLFQALTQLKLDLQAHDQAAVNLNIDTLKTAEQDIVTQQAKFAGTYKQMQLTKDRIEDFALVNSKETSRIQDVDLAKAVSDLNFQQNLYQASLQVMAKLLQTSLVNFVQ